MLRGKHSPDFYALHYALWEAIGGKLCDEANVPRTLEVLAELKIRGFCVTRDPKRRVEQDERTTDDAK